MNEAERQRLKEVYEAVCQITPKQAYQMLLAPDTTEDERRFWSFVGDVAYYRKGRGDHHV